MSTRQSDPEADSGTGNGGEGTGFLSHLVELRQRVVRMALCVGVIFLGLFFIRETLYTWLAGPLLAHMPEGSNMIAIEVASPFLIPVKLALMASIFLSAPYILYQVWAFVAPGLYIHEKRLVRPLIAASVALFYIGMAFAYFVVFPLVFGFFTAASPVGVEVMTDISRYLSFVLLLFFAFGVAFQVPVATIMLVLTGATTPEDLGRKRPYVVVGAFIIGMVLTPPDAISQTLLALPMWLLFEAGIWLAKMIRRRQAEEAARDADNGDE